MGYPTTAELVAASSVTALTALDSTAQDALRASSIAAIEEYTGQSFVPVEETVFLDGQGSSVLFLPRRLAAMDGASVRGHSFIADDLLLTSQGTRLQLAPLAGLGYYEQALAEVSGEDFPTGFANVSITGTWGWLDEEFPEGVGIALRLDMEETAVADTNPLSPTISQYRKLGLRSIDQGNLTASLTGVPGVSSRVGRLLDPYIFFGQMGALA